MKTVQARQYYTKLLISRQYRMSEYCKSIKKIYKYDDEKNVCVLTRQLSCLKLLTPICQSRLQKKDFFLSNF